MVVVGYMDISTYSTNQTSGSKLTKRVSYKRQELLARRGRLLNPGCWWDSCCSVILVLPLFAHLFTFMCCVFLLCLFSSCILCTRSCQFLWIVHSWLPLRFSQTLIYNTGVGELFLIHCITLSVIINSMHRSAFYWKNILCCYWLGYR